MIFVLFIIILSSVVGVFYFVNYREFTERYEDSQSKIEEIKRQIANVENVNKDLREAEEKLQKVEEELAYWKKKISDKANIPLTLKRIEEISLKNKVKFNEIRIDTIVPSEGYSEIPIEMVIIGPYHDVGRFLRELEYAKLFNVNGGTINIQPYVGSRASSKPEINLLLKVKLYILNLSGGGDMGEY
jgi:type IV pilus assembly protein PilO